MAKSTAEMQTESKRTLRAGAARFSVAALLTALASACGEPTAAGTATDSAQSADTALAACGQFATTPGGNCCASGQFWDSSAGQCSAVGPPECASIAVASPASCVPRWCFDWRDDGEQVCQANSEGCFQRGRVCAASELAAACLAGTAKDGAGPCLPAGLTSAPTASESEAPDWMPTVPALSALDATETQSFCAANSTDAVAPCAVGPCGAATMPDPDQASGCRSVGVPWVCPPGFIVVSPATATKPAVCTPDPALCPSTGFGELAALPNAVFVDSSAVAGGKGTVDAPFKSLNSAVTAAPEGATIVVAAGTYSGGVDLTKQLTIQGVCAAKVKIAGGAAFGFRVWPTTPKAAIILRSMTLSACTWGLLIGGHGQLHADHLAIEKPNDGGVWISGSNAKLTLARSEIADVVALSTTTGIGIAVDHGAAVILSEVRIAAARTAGVFVNNPQGSLDADGLRVDGTRPALDGKLGLGILAQASKVSLKSTRLWRNHMAGLAATQGATVQVCGLVVDATQPQQSDGLRGIGIWVQEAAHFVGVAVRSSGNFTGGLIAVNKGSSAALLGAVVDRTLGQLADSDGAGVVAQQGAKVTLARSRITLSANIGLYAAGAGTSLFASDSLVDSSLPTVYGGAIAVGAQVVQGASMSLQRVRLSKNRAMGIVAGGSKTRLIARDVQVDSTEPRIGLGDMGYGAGIIDGARASFAFSRLTGNHTVGLTIRGAQTVVQAFAVRIDHTKPRASDGSWGAGIFLQKGGGRLHLLGLNVSDNHVGGINANMADQAEVAVFGTVVERSRPELTGESGAGVMLVGDGDKALFHSCLLRSNHAGGFAANHAGFELHGSVILDTQPSTYAVFDSSGKVTGETRKYADGVVIDAASRALVANTLIVNHLRSGVLVSKSKGVTVRNCAASQGYFGFATQSPVEVILEGNLWHANAVQQSSEQGLFVPPVPVVVIP